ncbi:MAG: pilus assembly protein PilM [Candidatus Omnitrophica bacterium]|nr:pilus assembly protein PilM [Candidatus Omnitrophota bacterium]
MKSTKTIYALDIGSSSLKFAKCERGRKGLTIRKAQIYSLPLEFNKAQTEQEKIKGWIDALAKMLQEEKGGRQKKIVVSLPADLTFVRYITLPKIPVSKIHKIIRFEAEQQIPFLLSDVEWSYEILPSPKKEVAIVIGAAKKKFVEELTKLLASFHFRVESFEASQLVLYNLAQMYEVGKSGTIIVDIGMQSTQVVILCKGLSWGRTLWQGSFRMTKLIAEQLKIDIGEAEKLKRARMHDGSFLMAQKNKKVAHDIVDGIIKDNLYGIINEISRTMSYYLSIMRGAVFQKIILTGGGTAINHIDTFFEKNLGIKTEIADYTSHVIIPPHLKDHFSTHKNLYHIILSLACGYRHKRALHVNLLSEELRQKRVIEAKRGRIRFFFGGIVLILLMVIVNFNFELLIKQNREETLQKQFKQIGLKEDYLNVIEHAIAIDADRLALLLRKINERVFLPKVLKDIEAILPHTIWFDSLEYNQENKILIISGRATETLEDINHFTNQLRTLLYVHDVTFDAANIEEETSGKKPLRVFTIRVRFKEEKNIR